MSKKLSIGDLQRVRAGVTAPQKTNSQFCYFFKSCTFKGLMYAVCPPRYLGHLSLFEEFKVSLKPSWPEGQGPTKVVYWLFNSHKHLKYARHISLSQQFFCPFYQIC